MTNDLNDQFTGTIMFSRFEFILTETFLSLRRHPGMAFAAIACVMASLFVGGLVGLIVVNAQQLVDTAMEKVRFDVYFHPETSRHKAWKAYKRIIAMPEVDADGTVFISKEKGFAIFAKDEPQLEQLVGNPLPDSIQVKPAGLNNIKLLKETLSKWPDVEKVDDMPTISSFLLNASNGIKKAALVLGLILAVLALIIIHHTIELTIFARRKEIHIMALVGATPGTVGLPFLLEGMLYGLLGAAISVGLLAAGYSYSVQQHATLYKVQLVPLPLVITLGALLLLVSGVVLGLFGSLGSVVKYLHRPKSRITNA